LNKLTFKLCYTTIALKAKWPLNRYIIYNDAVKKLLWFALVAVLYFEILNLLVTKLLDSTFSENITQDSLSIITCFNLLLLLTKVQNLTKKTCLIDLTNFVF